MTNDQAHLDDAHVSIPDVFQKHGTYMPDKPAVMCGAQVRTWGEFNGNINRLAHALLRAGLSKGEKVAVMMGNSAETLEAIFGVVKAGGCVVPLSGMLTGEQLAQLINDSDSVAAIASAEFRDKLRPHLGELGGIREGQRIAALGVEDGWTPMETFLGDAPDTPPPVNYAPSDDFNIIYSSGTTGLPKGIVQTHRARLHWAFSNAIEMGITQWSRSLTTTALYSNGTWLMMLPTLFVGGTLVVMPAFGPEEFLRTIEAQQITHTFMVPAQYQMVLDSPEFDDRNLSSLQILLCAGSPLRLHVKEEVIRRFGDKLIELYGFSEGFASMLKPGQHEEKMDTVGVPVIGFEVRILDDEGNALPRGEVGEIAGYGAGMMKAYHGNPEKTAELIWHDERGRTFIRSGDIGMMDEDGFLRIVDRKKDMIISGGFNVFPADIEAVVTQHPHVSDATVIGVPHPKWDEAPLALVIPRPGTAPDPDEVRDWCNGRLAKFQRLHAVEIRDELPRNALGKVLRRLLRDPYWNN